jgi:hypothetical protein
VPAGDPERAPAELSTAAAPPDARGEARRRRAAGAARGGPPGLCRPVDSGRVNTCDRLRDVPRGDNRYNRALEKPRRIRVDVYLDADAVADLELFVAYRRGKLTRSAVVREAVDWLRAKEAEWLVGRRRYEQLRRVEVERDEIARTTSWAERDRRAQEDKLERARVAVRELGAGCSPAQSGISSRSGAEGTRVTHPLDLAG